jgi:pantetheine-phosphate adenylyltransferase
MRRADGDPMTTAIYPGTFDPVTSGHVDAAERAARLVDRVIIAVAAAHHKTPGLSLQERVALVREALRHVPSVEVEAFDGLLVDFAAQHGASVVVRGLRTTDSLSNELAMAVTNRGVNPDLQVLFLPASEDRDHISSTVVRELVASGGDLSAYVSPAIEQRIRAGYGREP